MCVEMLFKKTLLLKVYYNETICTCIVISHISINIIIMLQVYYLNKIKVVNLDT